MDLEKYLDTLCAKYPDWAWTLNTKAWLVFSRRPLSQDLLLDTIKLLEQSVKLDGSSANNAKMRLATLLWIYEGTAVSFKP